MNIFTEQKMKVHCFSVMALMNLIVLCSSIFDASFIGVVDQIIERPTIIVDDPDLAFFTDVMKFRQDAIDHVIEDALTFFNDSYGLDFFLSIPNERNERFLENAKLAPFVLSDEINYVVTLNSWIRSGSTRSSFYTIRDGGFGVTFSGDQTLYGSYGGATGLPARSGELIVYGFYNIPVCVQSPVIIQYQSGTPFRAEPIDGFGIINCQLYNRVLGFGTARGIGSIQPDGNGNFHTIIRNVFTFPGHE